MANSQWNTNNIPDQSGRVVVITGATSGLGKEATKILAFSVSNPFFAQNVAGGTLPTLRAATDENAKRLWDISEQMTGIQF